jgi:hypothetical protein
MNASSLSTEQAQRLHYAEVRKRLYGKPAQAKVIPPAPKIEQPAFIPKFLHLQPLWKREYIHFDAHIHDWRIELLARSSPLKAYIIRRSAELGYNFDHTMKRSRKREIVDVRHLIMWEIKRLVKPSISYPELGRLFGGYDHTSCLSAVRRIDRKRSNELAGEAR